MNLKNEYVLIIGGTIWKINWNSNDCRCLPFTSMSLQ